MDKYLSIDVYADSWSSSEYYPEQDLVLVEFDDGFFDDVEFSEFNEEE